MTGRLKTRFAHHKLEVWHLAMDLAVSGRRIAQSIPRGDRDLANHLKRSATAPVLLIGEGANRLNDGEKRQRFNEACGEVCEAVVAVELALALGLVTVEPCRRFVVLADKVAAMLTGLIRRYERSS